MRASDSWARCRPPSGMGLLISGYVSLKLSRRMGLINGKSHAPASNEIARSV